MRRLIKMRKIFMICLLMLPMLMLGCLGQEIPTTESGNQVSNVQETPTEESGDGFNGYFTIPVSEVSSQAEFYTYDSGGASIRFFAVKGADGVIRTAFDACDVCYASNKGYSQNGDSMVCNNCGLHFRISDLGTKNRGRGCWPAYIENEVRDGYVLIDEQELDSGRFMFS